MVHQEIALQSLATARGLTLEQLVAQARAEYKAAGIATLVGRGYGAAAEATETAEALSWWLRRNTFGPGAR